MTALESEVYLHGMTKGNVPEVLEVFVFSNQIFNYSQLVAFNYQNINVKCANIFDNNERVHPDIKMKLLFMLRDI